jgi:hypothetical protein
VEGTGARVAFVSTNSISQGEQVDTLWSPLFARGFAIEFAHRTFPWTSEAPGAAHVHVIIVGFSQRPRDQRLLYDYPPGSTEPIPTACKSISPYLIVGPSFAVPSRTRPRPGGFEMIKGSQPTDGGHLIFTASEAETFVAEEPAAAKWMRPYVGSDELINGGWRRCLWLRDAGPADLRAMPKVRERLARVRETRLQSPTQHVKDFADRPALFTQDRQPTGDYLAVPEVSSERRRYIPIAWLPQEVIASSKLQIIRDASLFAFGLLTSQLHMAWVRVVAGRLESRLSYSSAVLHNFPVPPAETPRLRAAVERAAQRVLDQRAHDLPPNGEATLADLYDPDTMPPGLVKAHQALDKAVDKLYRPDRAFGSDRERVEWLFELFAQQLIPAAKGKKGKTGKTRGGKVGPP